MHDEIISRQFTNLTQQEKEVELGWLAIVIEEKEFYLLPYHIITKIT